MNEGYEMEGWNWNRLSEYYYRNGELENARIALDSAKMHIKYSQDPLYIDYLESLLSRNSNNYDTTIAALKNLNNRLIEHYNDHVTSSPIPAIITSYKSRAENYKQSVKNQKIWFWISISGLLLIIVGGGVILHRHIQSRKKENLQLKGEIDNVNSQNIELEQKIADITKEHNSAIARYSNELNKLSKEDAKKQSDLLHSILKNENDYCTQLFLVNENEKNSSPFIRNSIKEHTSEKS